MSKLKANSLRSLAKKLPSSVVSGALFESAEYIEELEKTWELLKIELKRMEEFYDRCNNEEEIHVVHDVQSLMTKMETGEYGK